MNFFSDLSPANIAISPEEIIVNLCLACLLGALIVFVYRYTNRDKAQNTSFLLTLMILSMVVSLVMMVIGNSIARAFSLVGALSIIRFRTVVKDNRDIAYVFFALAAGMTTGVGAYPLALFGVSTILVLLLLLDFIRFGTLRRGLFLLRFQYVPTDSDESAFLPIFDQYLQSFRRISVRTVRMGQFVENTYLIRLKRSAEEEQFLSRLQAIEGMERVFLLPEDQETEM